MAKSKYPEVLEKIENGLVEGWARDGLTDEQIAYNLGISINTFYRYKAEHNEFCEALKKGKEVIDYQVENALLKRALGYTYDEITYEDEKPVKKVVKQVAPDVTAQIFWLKNRKPVEWRDKRAIEHSGTVDNPYQDLTTEELRKLIGEDDGD